MLIPLHKAGKLGGQHGSTYAPAQRLLAKALEGNEQVRATHVREEQRDSEDAGHEGHVLIWT